MGFQPNFFPSERSLGPVVWVEVLNHTSGARYVFQLERIDVQCSLY